MQPVDDISAPMNYPRLFNCPNNRIQWLYESNQKERAQSAPVIQSFSGLPGSIFWGHTHTHDENSGKCNAQSFHHTALMHQRLQYLLSIRLQVRNTTMNPGHFPCSTPAHQWEFLSARLLACRSIWMLFKSIVSIQIAQHWMSPDRIICITLSLTNVP